MAASSLWERAGTASRMPLNWRWPSTNRSISVSETTVAERGRRSRRASSPKYWPGPRVAMICPLRLTVAWPSTMRKNSRPMVPSSQRTRPAGTVTSSVALRMVRRSRVEHVENSQMVERSRSLGALAMTAGYLRPLARAGDATVTRHAGSLTGCALWPAARGSR